jgi:acetyl-CoA synthetase
MPSMDPDRASAARIVALLAIYEAPEICPAVELCDRHDPATVAYTVVSPDLSAQHLTYGSLRAESERLAAAFRDLGIVPGDRIATLMGKSRALLVTLTAIWRVGAVHVPLFTAFAAPAIAMRLDASRAKLVICDDDQRAKLDRSSGAGIVTTGQARGQDLVLSDLLGAVTPTPPLAKLGGDAPLIEIYTSGTTGAPKGVIVPIRALAAFQAYAELGLGLEPDDLFWNCADPGWGYGLYFGVLAALTTGVRGLMLEGGFKPETSLAVLERYGVTNFAAAPTVYRSLRASGLRPQRPLALRRASSAGEPLTPEVNEWALGALGVEVHDHYGQTEAGMLINNHQHPALRRPLKPGSMGRAMPGWSAVVLDADSDRLAAPGAVGRVALDLTQSPLAWFKGYVDAPAKSAEKFTADGRWYLTGDVGRIDKDGDFYFASRDDDIIIMAGYRIGPFEVESVILTHPAVNECAVIAVPNAVRGEVLEAAVVLQPGQTPSEALTKAIQTLVKTGFAAHAYPRQVHYLSELPKTASGKVQRFVLRQQLAGGIQTGQVSTSAN